jgi:ectoine hydroxylase-related dioxygenase (phytanoyl-CoA dioxygenase family)
MTPKLHPLNRSFRWEQPRGPYRRITPAQARAYDEDGFFVLDDAFDAGTVQCMIDEIDPLERRVEDFLRTQDGGRFFIAQADAITFSVHLVSRSRALRELCAGPVFQDLAHDLIGPDVRLYWDQAVYKKPEPRREFPWHQDNGYTYVEPQQYLTCWIALGDATLDNGCPWVAPGLHRRGTLEHWMTDVGWACLEHPERSVPVEARAGSIVVFSSLTPHRTGPNRTDRVRKTYIVQLAPDGAQKVEEDAATGERSLFPMNAPERQFLVLRNGRVPDSH